MKHLTIRDPDTLAGVLRDVLKECGTHESAAALLEISQPHFTRLVRGMAPRRMEQATLQRLENAIVELFDDRRTKRDSLRAKLQSAVLGADAIDRLNRQAWWFQQMLLRFAPVIPLWRRLRPKYRSYFADFEQRMAKHGHVIAQESGEIVRDLRDGWFPDEDEMEASHAYRRLFVAELRALEPLYDDQLTAGIERSAAEVEAADEMPRYLDTAFRREAILMNRPVDIERARALTEQPLKRGKR